MRKILALTLALLLLLSPMCSANIPLDKQAHAMGGYIINDQLKRNTKLSTLERILVVTAIGTLKELTDSKFDSKDLLSTVAGGIFYEVKF